MPKRLTSEEKAQILARAAEIGAAAAAREAGVSYNGVLKWMKAAGNSIRIPVKMRMKIRILVGINENSIQ